MPNFADEGESLPSGNYGNLYIDDIDDGEIDGVSR